MQRQVFLSTSGVILHEMTFYETYMDKYIEENGGHIEHLHPYAQSIARDSSPASRDIAVYL